MNRRILVTGATGETGRYTTDLLISQGFKVRALVHKADERSEKLRARGAEVVAGDLLDFDAVRGATRGVNAAYFVYPIRPGLIDATAYFAQASKEAGLDGVVNMSQISAREDSKSHAARDHWIAERVFDWSGVPTAHIRPTFFAQWLLALASVTQPGPFSTRTIDIKSGTRGCFLRSRGHAFLTRSDRCRRSGQPREGCRA